MDDRLYPNIDYRFELNQRDGREPDVSDRLYHQMRLRVGPRLWNTLPDPRDFNDKLGSPGRSVHYEARSVKHNASYTRGRSKSCSSFGDCARGSASSNECRRPDFNRSDSHDIPENDEAGQVEYLKGDTRGRPNPHVASESKLDTSDEQECSFICFWRIENFCIEETSQTCSVSSQMFDILMINGAQWHLRVDHLQYKSLRLSLYRHGEHGCRDIYVELSLLTSEGWNVIKDGTHNRFRLGSPCIDTKLMDWCEQSRLRKYLPGDCLTISCHISIQSNLFNPVQYFMPSRMISHKLVVHSPILEFSDLNPSEVLNFPIPSIHLEYLSASSDEVKSTQTDKGVDDCCCSVALGDSDDLLKLFKEHAFRFVTLRTATKEFSVHKALLCARSPVFNAMFKGSTKESSSHCVDIDDVDGDCMSLLLRYFHLEPLSNLEWEEAAKLYYAADKYQVDSLTEECRHFLKKKLSNRNICDTFILADAHKDGNLRECAQEYFCLHSKTILCSSEWTRFLFNRVDLASKVLYRLAERMPDTNS